MVNELRSFEQIEQAEKYLDSTSRKIESMKNLLNTFEFTRYTISREQYFSELERFLDEYGNEEGLNVQIFSYEAEKDQENYLKRINQSKARVKRSLRNYETYFSVNDTKMCIPITVLNEKYVAEVKSIISNSEVERIDGNIINILLVAYVLVVEEPENNEGGVLDGTE
ncbi:MULTISPECIES: type II toxin-antitoxin system SpoIISA family toxin [Allobacillus]|uniref:type II toxin-antitoxin system SpoIISA family toxin n=2 Tax=Bacillaceae TaxID=186817 RepID=UPI00210342B8|nr:MULTISPECIES: type II toxin-antitoxin system SpoIISA family toxin [Allobacillus]